MGRRSRLILVHNVTISGDSFCTSFVTELCRVSLYCTVLFNPNLLHKLRQKGVVDFRYTAVHFHLNVEGNVRFCYA